MMMKGLYDGETAMQCSSSSHGLRCDMLLHRSISPAQAAQASVHALQ